MAIVELIKANIFQDSRSVLQNVNLTITEGEFCYLIGKTGSGKSSLLKTLYGALPLTDGKGTVANFNLRELNRKNIPLLRRQLGIVFQDFALLTDRSIWENLHFVLKATNWTDKDKIKTRIDALLKRVDLSHKAQKMPYEISGGEQQRAVIARALLNSPSLILADEPTGNLDPETSDDILTLLRQLAKEHQTAVLMATHDYRVLERFPARIIRCHNGRVIDDDDVFF